MSLLTPVHRPTWPVLAWLCAFLIGLAGPVVALLLVVDANAAVTSFMATGTIVAVGLMAIGMIAAAATGRMMFGILLAVLTGAGLIMLAVSMAAVPAPNPLAIGLTITIASISFAARGALFARSAGDKGWLIALAVVAGEGAIVLSAAIEPRVWPNWLLALLPAQWASVALQTALSGADIRAAGSVLLALAGTAAATMLVARLWPRRWPYLVMFSTWLGLSALVYHNPALPPPHTDQVQASELVSGQR